MVENSKNKVFAATPCDILFFEQVWFWKELEGLNVSDGILYPCSGDCSRRAPPVLFRTTLAQKKENITWCRRKYLILVICIVNIMLTSTTANRFLYPFGCRDINNNIGNSNKKINCLRPCDWVTQSVWSLLISPRTYHRRQLHEALSKGKQNTTECQS